MKKYNFLFLAVLLLVSCYKEDKLTVTKDVQIELFKFPQGDNPWDKEIVEIYEKYGVKLIYKDYDPVKFNGSWLAADNKSEHFGEDLNEEQVQYNVDFFKNEVFKYVSPELVKGCFPEYIYMCYDGHRIDNQRNAFPARFVVGNPGYWISCLEGTLKLDGTSRDSIDRPVTPIQLREARGRILQRIFCLAILKGKIKPPKELAIGGGVIDYTKPLRMSANTVSKTVDLTDPKVSNVVIDDPNLAITRGFPYALKSEWFSENIKDMTGDKFRVREFYLSTSISLVPPEKLLWDQINSVMRFSEEELRQGYVTGPTSTTWLIFPTLRERHPLMYKTREIVIDYMLNEYNVDLLAIYNGTNPQ